MLLRGAIARGETGRGKTKVEGKDVKLELEAFIETRSKHRRAKKRVVSDGGSSAETAARGARPA